MTTEVRFHRAATVLLTAALLATLTVALTGGNRADAVEGPVEVVYVATGQNFPDALAGANLAATVGAPMLTVNPDLPIPDPTITALQALDPNQIIILGGPVAVSDPVADALADHARSGAVTRIQGGDRHDTAAQIADALPDKVHDAERLDGLDSTDFLRSNTTIDADTVDGLSSDAFARTADVPTSSTVTEHVSCPGVGFESNADRDYGALSNTGRYVFNTGDGNGMTCPLTLPAGAFLKSVTFTVYDSSPTRNVASISLRSWNIEGQDVTVHASQSNITSDVGVPGPVTAQLPISAINGATDGARVYVLQATLDTSDPGASEYVAIYGATIEFDIERFE